MAVLPEWYEDDDTTALTTFDLDELSGGQQTSPVIEARLWNNNGVPTGDTLENVSVSVYERYSGETTWLQNRRCTTEGWVEARVVGKSGDSTSFTSNWTPLGANKWLSIPDIPADSAYHFELRGNLPAGATATATIQLKLVINYDHPASAMPTGSWQGGNKGIYYGIGDGFESGVLMGGELTGSGAATVACTDAAWLYRGQVYFRPTGNISPNTTDGDGATITNGESYWMAVSGGVSVYGASADFIYTKGSKGTYPLADSAKPDVPSYHALIGYIEVHYTGGAIVIASGDVEQPTGEFFYRNFGIQYDAASHTVEIGKGEAGVGGNYIRRNSPTNLTVTASQTDGIWLLSNGNWYVGGAWTRPSDMYALHLWSVTSDGSGVTSVEDKRKYVGHDGIRFDAHFSPCTVDSYEIFTVPDWCNFAIPLPKAVRASVENSGSATAGSTIFEIEYSHNGGSWTSLYPSSGSNDLRPTVTWNAADPIDHGSTPEIPILYSGDRVRVRVAAATTTADALKGHVRLDMIPITYEYGVT